MNDHYKAPEFGLLALNGAAITALTAFWDTLKDDDPANFGFAFILFALGAMTAVYAAYCRFIRIDEGSTGRLFERRLRQYKLEQEGLSPAELTQALAQDFELDAYPGEPPWETLERYRGQTRRLWILSGTVLAVGIMILLVLLAARSDSNWANGFRLFGLAILLSLPPIVATQPFGKFIVAALHRFSAIASLGLFSAGVLIAIGTLAQNQALDLEGTPGSTDPKETVKPSKTKAVDPGDGFEFGGGTSGGGGAQSPHSVNIYSIGGTTKPRDEGQRSSSGQDINVRVVCEVTPREQEKKRKPQRPNRTPRKQPPSKICRP